MQVDTLRSPGVDETGVSNLTNRTGSSRNGNVETCEEVPEKVVSPPRIIWTALIFYSVFHVGALYGFSLLFTRAKLLTSLWALLTIYMTGVGVTAGAHRLWTHKSYKAKWPLRFLLILLFTAAGQGPAFGWILNHRLHHKYSDTDADPHNAKRSLFFAHIGWLFTTSHPEVVAKRRTIDMSDFKDDPFLKWQTKYYWPLFVLLGIAVPASVPWYFWNESLWVSFWVNFNLRHCLTLNITFTVNSIGHTWGNRPYDKHISPVDNVVMAVTAFGDGWHNYHHAFPWDYKTGELGGHLFNATTAVIDGFALLGWAYDRKYVSPEMVRRRAIRSGDGSHVWGYGDLDISNEDLDELDRMLDKRSLYQASRDSVEERTKKVKATLISL